MAIISLYATKDAALRANRPNANYSGKSQAVKGYGFGIKTGVQGGNITYPILTLDSTASNFIPKNSFLLGGFDAANISGKTVKKTTLVLYINYAGVPRKKVCVFVRKVIKSWDEMQVTYNDVYSKTGQNASFTDLIDPDDNHACYGTIDVESNSTTPLHAIPFPDAPGYWKIDITRIVSEWAANPDKNFGLLVDPPWWNHEKYVCENVHGKKSNLGEIEIAPSEWLDWDGKVPASFQDPWLDMTNNARGKKEFIPRIDVEV